MPRSSEQKLKTLYLLRFLHENTDNDHFVTMEEIISYLEKNGISAERKSIYSDINALNEYGIETEYKKHHGYRLVTRQFELSEIKLLVDTVQASKFLTHKKSEELIKKIECLTNRYGASELQHSVIMHERIKTMNESVYISVDAIRIAMTKNRKITFKYFDWDVNKKKVFHKNGEYYKVSPWALMWDDENYYLVGFDSDAGIIKHYRVDKMMYISMTDEKREGHNDMTRFDTAKYSKKMFGMYGGETRKVKIRCKNELAGKIFDRFGFDIIISKCGDYFETVVEVAPSPVFFAWVIQFGGKVVVCGPDDIKNEMMKYLKNSVCEMENMS